MSDTPQLTAYRDEFGPLGPTINNPTSAADLLALGRAAQGGDNAATPLPSASNNQRYWMLMGVVAMAGMLMLGISFSLGTPSDGPIRARGQMSMPPITLQAVLDGENGRQLRSGDQVPTGEKVVFRVTGGAEGYLVMTENGQPMTEPRNVQAGARWLSDTPMAWTPDDLTNRTKVYEAKWCPEKEADAGCSRAELTLRW